MSIKLIKILLVVFIIGMLLNSSLVDAKSTYSIKYQNQIRLEKKTKKGKKEDEPQKSSSKRPTKTSPELYCNACQAIIRELLKKLKHRTSESDVMEAMSEVCEPEQYMTYEFPPPEMKEGCEAFIMDWEEIVERELIKRQGNKEVEDKVCLEISQACKGVNVKDAPKMDDHIFVDGQPVPVGKDGKVDLQPENKNDL